MAVYFYTDDPRTLLTKFLTAIHQHEPQGKVETWITNQTGDVTHKSERWGGKAWMEPHIETNRLRFNIIKTISSNVTDVVFSYYHGHFIETFSNHFDRNYTVASATALADLGDRLT